MEGVIYIAINQNNGKSYIGQTNNFEKRKKGHENDACVRGRQTHFYHAIRKYGWDAFAWEILDRFESDSKDKLRDWLNKMEKYYIDVYDTFNTGYNSTTGGDYDYKLHEDVIGKISEKVSGVPRYKSRKKVVCVETGQIFESVTDAVNFVSGLSHIHTVCKSGGYCGGYQWRYLDDYQNMSSGEIEALIDPCRVHYPHDLILCLDTGVLAPAMELAEIYNLDYRSILRVAVGKRNSTGGYRFIRKSIYDSLSHDELDIWKNKPILEKSYSYKVRCIDLDRIYVSAAEAQRDLGLTQARGVLRACSRPNNNKYKGYRWEFV